jgi:hypothetical protein
LWLQQSPGQHDDCPWQQLAPQQLPGQHFAPDWQQDAPVSASADRENREVATIARIFAFMEFSFQCEGLDMRPKAQRRTEHTAGSKSADRL